MRQLFQRGRQPRLRSLGWGGEGSVGGVSAAHDTICIGFLNLVKRERSVGKAMEKVLETAQGRSREAAFSHVGEEDMVGSSAELFTMYESC